MVLVVIGTRGSKAQALNCLTAPRPTVRAHGWANAPTCARLDLNGVMSFDLYPIETIESRKRYYLQAVPDKGLTRFTHDARLPWAYVVRDVKGKTAVGE